MERPTFWRPGASGNINFVATGTESEHFLFSLVILRDMYYVLLGFIVVLFKSISVLMRSLYRRIAQQLG